MKQIKPRVLIDIKGGKDYRPFRIFEKANPRLDLGKYKTVFIAAKPSAKIFFILTISAFFIFSSVNAPVRLGISMAAQTEDNIEKRKTLEMELVQYEKQIDEYEQTITNLKKQGKSLKSEIDKLNAKIAQLNIQIKAVGLNIKKLDEEIGKTQEKISVTEKDIDFNKGALSNVLQNMYENEKKGLLEVVLANSQLSDFFGYLNNLMAIQENLKLTLLQIVELHGRLIDEKEVLALERADAQTLKEYRDSQKINIQETQKEKGDLLKVTKNKESEYQKVLVETKKTAAEIRKQIFKLLGGGELSFEEAYDLAKFAEKATGVRAALILAVLDRESALGRNVGRCGYKIAMHPTRDLPKFLIIVNKLGINPDSVMVSCPISSDGAYGGAMGPAQFIPSTWMLYKDKIAEITGSNPPNPWKNTDAFVGTALYLRDAGAANSEKIAAAKYYCGVKWNRYVCTNVYAKKVVDQANRFQDDIDILSS